MLVADPPERYLRRSVRLPDHDYRGGLYLVTICMAGRLRLFGEVADGVMRLSPAGVIVRDVWMATPSIRPEVAMDAFVVMPDHVHVLFGIVPDATDAADLTGRGVSRYAPTSDGVMALDTPPPSRSLKSPSRSVGAVVRGLKGAATVRINRSRGTPGTPVWQRSFHDRVVRTRRQAEHIRRYIAENPARWTG